MHQSANVSDLSGFELNRIIEFLNKYVNYVIYYYQLT